jgi:hypothetical protein
MSEKWPASYFPWLAGERVLLRLDLGPDCQHARDIHEALLRGREQEGALWPESPALDYGPRARLGGKEHFAVWLVTFAAVNQLLSYFCSLSEPVESEPEGRVAVRVRDDLVDIVEAQTEDVLVAVSRAHIPLVFDA